MYLGWGTVTILLAWIGFAASWRLMIPGFPGVSGHFVLLAALVASAAAALSPVVVSAGITPVRSLVALPVLYAALSSLPFRFRIRTNIGLGVLVLLGFSILVNVWITTSLFYSDARARERDAIMASRLIQRIEDVGRPKFGPSIPITVAGAWSHSPVGLHYRVEEFGTSFFEKDGGNPWRIVYYLRLMGLVGVQGVPLKSIPGSIETIRQMPAWPDPQSVAVIADVLVIKFSDLTYQQEVTIRP